MVTRMPMRMCQIVLPLPTANRDMVLPTLKQTNKRNMAHAKGKKATHNIWVIKGAFLGHSQVQAG